MDTASIESETVGRNRIATVPNALSLLRLVIVGVALGLLFGVHARIVAASLLGVAGTTDFLDGYVARRFNQVSELGKVLDPTVDRLVLLASAISVVIYGAVPIWLAAVVLVREGAVALAALWLAAAHAERFDVLFIGKASAFGLMTALPLFLGSDGPGAWEPALRLFCWIGIGPVLALSFISAGAYVPKARAALRAAKASQ